jgi:hypothetical protein
MEGIAIKESESQIEVTLWANKPVILTVFPLAKAQLHWTVVADKEKKTAEAGETAEMQPPVKAVKRVKTWRVVRAMKSKDASKPKAVRGHFKKTLSSEDVKYAAKSMGVFTIPHLMMTYKGNNTVRAQHKMACYVSGLIRRGLVKRTGNKVNVKGSIWPHVEYAWVGE